MGVQESCNALAEQLEAEAAQLAVAIFARSAARFPDWMREAPVDGQIRAMLQASIVSELDALRRDDLPESLPEADLEGIRGAVQGGTPLPFLLDGYRAVHQALWDRWAELVRSETVQPESKDDVAGRGSDFFFAYAGRLSTLAETEYSAERERMLRSTETIQAEAICALLEGDETQAARLDHPVAGHNIGLVGKGRGLADLLPLLARELDCRLLILDVLPDPWWAWLGRSRPFEPNVRGELAKVAASSGSRVGVGDELAGAAGFRESHRQATTALRACQDGRPVVDYGDVAVEDLAMRDPDAARAFVSRELDAIAGEDQRSRRLRETLAAYFNSESNARVTAKQLGIHQQTVAQRLAAIEQRLGHGIGPRRVELGLALRLIKHLESEAP